MSKKITYVLFVPCIILVFSFMILPLIGSVLPTIFGEEGITFASYSDFFKDPYNLKIFWRTMKISSISAVISMIIGVPTAYFILGFLKNLEEFLWLLQYFLC